MRIICPGCASHYEVDADKIGADGQLVRCVRCRDTWLARRPGADAGPGCAGPDFGEAAAPPSPDVVGVAPIDFARAKARLRPRAPLERAGAAGTLAVVAVVGVLSAGGMTALGKRDAIVRHLPAAGGLYAAIGLPAPQPLALRDVRSSLVAEGDKTVLMLQGTISNLGRDAAPVPALSVVVRDAGRASLYAWTAPAPKPRLAGGETVAFRSRLAAPPAAGQDVRVTFADASVPGRGDGLAVLPR